MLTTKGIEYVIYLVLSIIWNELSNNASIISVF